MSSSALCLNLLVSGVAFWVFLRASYFSWELTWPFIVTSVPLAFFGGFFKVSSTFYSLLLACVLLVAACRLNFDSSESREKFKRPPLKAALPIGGAIGILSGIVGVGGGIFLSPLLLIFRWASPKQTAATSAYFIMANSLAGLLGRMARHALQFSPFLIVMVIMAFLGGMIGSRLGANHFSGKWLRRILAGSLVIASIKLVLVASLA
jgi:hypothetical protein